VKAFWEHWEERNIAHYWEPYRRYRDICELSLAESFAQFGVKAPVAADPALLRRLPPLPGLPDVAPTLDRLAKRYRLAVVSNIDDDLFAETRLGRTSTSSARPSAPAATSLTARSSST
jgi:2-haloacid dehalogenase